MSMEPGDTCHAPPGGHAPPGHCAPSETPELRSLGETEAPEMLASRMSASLEARQWQRGAVGVHGMPGEPHNSLPEPPTSMMPVANLTPMPPGGI